MRTALCVGVIALGWLSGQSARPILPGDPLPGITAAEFELVRIGLEDFSEVENASDGLGPAFNGTGCSSCHSVPAVGGMTSMTEVRVGYVDEDGRFNVLNGGTLYPLFSIPNHLCQVVIPEEANVIARRMPIPLFGDGLIEAISDATILALEDPDDRNGDGIHGRAARVMDPASRRERIGRFGWKAQQATLLSFSGDAYRNEMGITNDIFPDEYAPGIDEAKMKLCSPKRGVEDVRNRQTGLRAIDNFTNFTRLLAPPARGAINDDVRNGAQIFASAGCAACHTPTLMTAQNANPVFDRKPVDLFSDLLLHDVGTGDGIEQAGAAANEIRTPPLWGLRIRKPFLHDGSAGSIEEAIRRHAGEATSSVARYRDLSRSDSARLMAFLKSL